MECTKSIANHVTRLRRAIALLFVLMAAHPVIAQFITTDVSQYAHNAWLARDGAFRGSALNITQTQDGNLWIGTPFGLLRFDGSKFTPGAPKGGQQFTTANIEKVLGARDGSLWIGGAGLSRLKDGRVISIAELDGTRVDAILEDHAGNIWAGGRTRRPNDRLCRISAVATECFGDSKSFGIQISTLFEDKAGNIWVSSTNGLWRWAPGKPDLFPNQPANAAIAIDANDLMVSMAKRSGPTLTGSRQGQLIRVPITMTDLLDCVFLTDHLGGLWIGTRGHGIVHSLHGRIDTYTPADGLSSDVVFDLFEDREEDVWAVTANGIDRLRKQAVTLVTAKQGLSSNSISTVLSDGRTMWIATHHGLDRVTDHEIRSFNSLGGVSVGDPSSLFSDGRGRIVIATGPPDGIAWLDHDHITSQHLSIGDNTFVITTDGVDGVWLSNRESGLVHVLRPGGPVEILPWSRFDNKNVNAMAFDPARKGLWMAFHNGDLLFFREGQVQERYRNANQPFQHPTDLHVDADGTIWVGSNAGLSRLRNGTIATLSSRNGLPCDGVHWRQEDDRQATWLETSCGVVRLAPGELDRWSHDPDSRVQIQTYLDNLDGAESMFYGGHFAPPVSMTLDARLAYGSDSGLAIIDPHQEMRNLQKPPVHIDSVEADAQTYSVDEHIALAPKIHVVRLDYSALSFRAPQKVRFRYKLAGYDADWSQVLSTREAVYTNLPPGNYTFHVIACNDSGIWNEVGDTLNFSVDAAYYQTRWFFWTCVLTFALLMWIAYRARVSYLYREVSNRIQTQTSERLNVSQDLHDTLLQGVQGLILSFHAISEDPSVNESVKKRISNLSGRAEEVVNEGRDKIRSLRFEKHPNHGFVEELRTLAHRIHPEDLPEVEITLEGKEVTLNPLVFEELCLICREALSNAFRHSNAQKVDVQVTYARSRFSVQIRDDGGGLQHDARQSGTLEGHWGIVGMQERALRIGARFDVKTPYPGEPNPGTCVVIELPSALAYSRPKNSH